MIIESKIKEIKKFNGLELILCDNFKGILQHNGNKYFNIILPDKISESNDYNKILKLVKVKILKKVEPNGLKRVALFF